MDAHFWKVTESFVGNKWESYYSERLKRAEKTPFGWNWCAFLFSEMWFLYRKIPCIFGGIILFYLLSVTAVYLLSANPLFWLIVIMLAVKTVSGIFGDRWYYGSIMLKYRFFVLGDFNSGEHNTDEEFIRKGGTAKILLAAYIIIIIICIVCIL